MRARLLALSAVSLLAVAASSPAGAQPSVSSAADQYMVVGVATQGISPLTVTDDSVAVITAANDIRVRIPAGFNMTWNAADTSAVISGSAAAKVSTAVTYEDGDQTLVVDVVSDFAAADQIVVTGLSFTAFTAASPADSLELEVGNDGLVTAEDDKKITILQPSTPTRSTAITLTPDGQEVWVVNPDHGTVAVIATQGGSANTLQAEIPVGRDPWTVAAHPWNGEIWVTSERDDKVYVIDAGTRAVIDSLDAGFGTFGVAFNPQGTTALVTASGSDQVFLVDVDTRTITHTLDVYRRPRGVAWRGDGGRAWVSHLLMPEFFGRLTTVFISTSTTSEIIIQQVFNQNLGGYPSVMQNITVAPAPGDSLLWVPNSMLNKSNGQLFGNPMTPTNMFHACIRPVNINTSTDLNLNTYYMSESGTDVAGPIAVDFKSGRAYVANLNSDNVTVLTKNILSTSEVTVIPVGSAPIGIVAHPSLGRAYVANWLSRDVSVINTSTNAVIATVPTTTSEVLPPQVLNGKRHFFTSTGNMSINQRAACASCHVFGTMDGQNWDLSQFGKHIRATPDVRGIGFTGPHDWTADKDEMADHDFGIIEFAGGPGLIPGGGNPPLGAPNSGLSQDMDDIGRFMVTLTPRPDTPFQLPGGGQTAAADSGEVLFNDPTVGCATCHVPPFFTDSSLLNAPAFIKHDVGTADPADTSAAAGFDTPTLLGVWDTGPYLHHNNAPTLQSVMTTFNPGDLHGTTSQLATDQIDFIAEYLLSLGWPDSTGTAVAAPEIAQALQGGSLGSPFPNPFDERTSLRFSLDRNAQAVRIDVFDVRGRHVRTLIDRPLTRGTHVVGWDSRDDAGRRVGAGVYFARWTVDGAERGTRKMAVLR